MMKLLELFKSSDKSCAETVGTYAALLLTDNTKSALDDFCIRHSVPNKCQDYHTTIMYSRKHHPDFSPIPDAIHYGTPIAFDVFTDRRTDKNCLVLKYRSLSIEKRHYDLKNRFGATWDFDTFEPHITLSYDIGDFDVSKLSVADIKIHLIEFSKEYCELLEI